MKRFLLSVTLVLGIITSTIAQGVSVWDGSSTIWTNGSGTSSDPYLIESAANLAYLATSVNSGTTYSGKYFKQTVDIDLDAIGWTPIGTSSYTFQGTYNGNHKRIKNLSIYVNGASPVHIGLFGYVSSATIRNVEIQSGTISVSTNSTSLYTGSIIGYGAGTTTIDSCINNSVINITNTSSATSFDTRIGGIAGHLTSNTSTIKHTINKGKISYTFNAPTTTSASYTTYIGGLVGYLNYADISNSANIGEILVDAHSYYNHHYCYTGGLAGFSTATSSYPVIIENSYNRANIKAQNFENGNGSGYTSTMYLGGIIGYYNSSYHTVRYCYNTGDITPILWSTSSGTATSYAAGITGYLAGSTNTFTSCYNIGQVPSTYTAATNSNNNGTKNYNHDCMVYNPNNYVYTSSALFYNSDSCGCTKNQNNAGSVTDNDFKGNTLPGSLGTAYFSKDAAPYFNNGYPILKNSIYPKQVETLDVTDTNAMVAVVTGAIDMGAVSSYLTEAGFEYKPQAGNNWTKLPVTAGNNITAMIKNLTACQNYTVRAYAIISGITVYGDSIHFQASCKNTATKNFTICYNDTLTYNGQKYYPDGEYYYNTNDSTILLKITYNPSRECSIDTSIKYGDTLYINGEAFTQAGQYERNFATNLYGCDSIVHLKLQIDYSDAGADSWDCVTQVSWTSGAGTQANPYLIESAAQLAYLAEQVGLGNTYSGKYFKLIRDIDWNGCTWRAIGGTSTTSFSGHFDGDNHKIENITCTLNGNSITYAGFFGRLINGSVSNLYIANNCAFTAQTSSTTYYLGAVAAYASGTKINNCHNEAPINITHTGGLNSFDTYVGGIAGYVENGDTMKQCSNSGNITFQITSANSYTYNEYVGGLVGYVISTKLKESYNTAKVSSSVSGYTSTASQYVGGLAGYAQYSSAYKCFNSGAIHGTNSNTVNTTSSRTKSIYVGGIFGYSSANSSNIAYFNQCYNLGNFVVYNHSETSSYTSTANAFIGGMTGYASSYTNIDNCYNRGDFMPTMYTSSNSGYYAINNIHIGGIGGYAASSTGFSISNSYNAGLIPSTYTNAYTGSYATRTYNKDCMATYSTVTTNNCYYLNDCLCGDNITQATSKTRAELIAIAMPGTLNNIPSSGVWKRDDLPYVNNGYPIFGSMAYQPSLSTDSVGNLTAASADMYGTVNPSYMSPSTVTETGIEYKILGASTYTQVASTVTNGSFTVTSGILQPCTTYVYRAYAIVDGIYGYAETATFSTPCQYVAQIDTTICYGETLYFHNQSLYPDGEYIFIDDDTTFAVRLHYYPSNTKTISDTIDYGNMYFIGGIAYYTSGVHVMSLGTDKNGCDSSITIYLTVNYPNSSPDVWDCTTRSIWSAGDGSQAHPYVIDNAANLCYLADEVNGGSTFAGKYFVLSRDIDLNGCMWRAIGNTSSTSFQGHFDGANHEIKNLDVLLSDAAIQYGGLFGRVINGSVSNLYITGTSTLKGQTSSTVYYLGTIAAYTSNARIRNCHSEASVTINNTGSRAYAGGIVGYMINGDTLYGCTNKGKISYTTNGGSAEQYEGGLVGYATNTYLVNCYNKGNVKYYFNGSTSCSGYVGGLVGKADYSTVLNCFNTGNFDISNIGTSYSYTPYVYAGGILGYSTAASTETVTINKAYNKGNFTILNRSTGGYGSSYNAYNTTVYLYSGGIIGYANGGYTNIDNCYNRGNFSSTIYGVGGSWYYSGNRYYYANIYTYIAGFVGYVSSSTGSTLKNSYNAGLIPSSQTISSNSYTNQYYYKDCMTLNNVISTTNSYWWDNCLCGSNSGNATSKDSTWLASASAFGALNGSPSSDVWVSDDMPYENNGFPIYGDGLHDPSVYTLYPSDITSSEATLWGKIDTTEMPMAYITSAGFEYKMQGAATYTSVAVAKDDTLSISLWGLTPCSTYVYRAYILVNGNKIYGDDVKFTLGCYDFNIDTTICYGETFELFDKTFNAPNYYEFNVGSYAYTLDLSYYPQAYGSATVTLCKGQKYYVGQAMYSTAGTYIIDAGKNEHGCDSTLALTLNISNQYPPTVNILSADASVCPGGNTTLTASGADSYVWSTDETTPSITGTEGIVYTVTGTDAGTNCTATATISVPASLKVTISGDTVGICAGSSGTLTAAGADSYVWSTNETSPSITISPATTTTYWVKGTKGGCTDSVAVTVDVENYPIITISGAASVCAGESVVLTANGAVSYTWSTNENTPSVTVTPSFTTSYTVTGTTASGCSNTAVHTVTAIQPAQSSFTVNSSTPYSWNGQVYSTSGAYTQTFQRPGLCDSIVTLNLNIVSGSSIIKDTICKGDVYASFGFNIDTKDSLPGEYYYSINSGGNSISLNLYVKYAGSHTYIDTICKGNTYNNHGFTVNTTDSAAGTYSYTINYPIVGQCDSLVTLKLTVTPQPAPIDIYDTVCYGTPYYNSNGFMVLGLTDSVVGTHHLSSTSQIGDCYQTTNLYLTLNDKSYVHYYDTICQGNNYTGNGFTELTSSNAAGSYTFKKEVVNGYCRDTAVLHLFINEIDTINVTETICSGSSYSGYGFNNLSTASTYTGTIASANGCGSVVNLTLIVNPVYTPVFNETVCHGEPFVDYGFGINTKDSAAGTYTYIRNLKSADGCDSIVTLNLTISAPIVENHSDNICKGEVYTQYGFVIKTDTATADATYNYSKTYYTSKGCDSTINLALTVKGVSATTLYDTICAGSAYTLNGFNVATAGTHTLTKTAANGCDSIVTLHLTVNPLSYTTIYDTINQGEHYNENGFSNISTAGIHTLTATAANGCDSIVTLYLTVKMTAMVAEYDTICEGNKFSGHGFVDISTPGLHSTVVPDHNGQDSTIYLYLTVNPTVYTYIYDTICEGDTYNNNGFANIKTSGMHTLNTSAANGCDSIVNLLLTVKPFKTTTLTASICQGSVYNANGFNKSVAGTYHDTLTAANGCDSIVTLILNVNNTYNDTVYATAIIGDVYSQNGFNVNTTGMSAGIHYLTTGHLFSSTGCDSMFTVVLTLNAPNITTYYDTICHSGTYIDGNFTILTKDSVAGTYLYSRKYIVASGDSTVQLYLTINPQIHTDIYDTTCAGQAYIANGFSANANDLVLGNNILNSNVIYTSKGCDSTATLYLFVKPTKTTNITDAVCQGESYTNYGFNVTNIQTQYPGTASFTQNLTTSQNCDSTVILTLTINEIKSTSLTDVICKGGVYTDNGFIIRTKDSVPGTYNYVQTLKTVNGCDSTVTLTLTIDNPIETVFSDAVTAGTNYVGHGFITGSDTMVPGTYTFVNSFNTPNGCDSIVTLHLVINNAAQTTTLYDTVCHGSGNYNNFDFSFSTYGLPAGTHIYTNTIGDSTVNLFLTVNPIIVVDMYDTTCGGPNYTLYDFNIQTNNVAEGVTVDQSHTTYTASGCDSTTRMHLLVHQPVTTNIAASVCQGDEYNLNGFNVTSAQTQNVGTASYTQNLYTINNCDSTVILTLTVNEVKSTSLTDAICKGGVYTDNGFIIKTKDSLPGTYSYVRTLKTTQGCDSIVTLNLTVNVPLTQNVSDVITAGNNYVGYGFNTHSDTLSAGTYTFSNTYHTPDGCDSVVILTLTVNNAAQTTTLYDSVCHGVGIYSNFDFSINTTGLSEGTYTHTRAIGDSTVILHLTVRPTIVVDMYDTTCGGPNYTLYDFNIQTNNVAEGVTVDQSHTTYNASGCDSITRMHLLVHQPVTTNIAASVCQGDEYNLNGFNVTSIQTQSVGTTSYTQNLHTVNNCDSTVILTLTVNEVKSTSLTDAICKGGVYTDYNFVIKTKDSIPGTYTYIKNLKTTKGCDSTVTLTLTINNPITENFNDAITAGNNYIGYGFNTHSDTLVPGTYTFSSTYHTSDGCDSVVILTLVVNNPAQTTTIYDTVCHGIGIYGNYDFSINTTGLAEGTYTHTRAIGDSTVILYLTVKPTITVDIYDTVCGGANYMLHGFNIVTANIADGTIIEQTNNNYTAGGCDSATTLHLVIHQADTTWLTATVCQGDEYNLYGFNVTSIETGTAGTTTYTQNLSTQYTCDSTVILTLTVNEVKSTTLTDAICKGGVYTDYDFVIKTKDSTPGTYTYIKNLKSDKGCDSTVTLTLTINNPIENNFNEVILVGTSYIGHGFVTNSDTLPAGTYTYTNKFNTPEGCDSIVILTLVINNPASTTVLYDTVCHGVGIYSNYDFTITTTGLAPGTYLESHYLLDSTVHLYLTVNPPIHAIYYDTICSGSNYSKYGFSAQAADLAIGLNTFNSVSTYTADGCDSSATLYLTVNKNDTTLITATVCKNQTYIGYGFNIPTDSAGVFSFEQNLSNANNCDSTVILQLTVNEIYNTILNGIVCKGGVYTDNGFIIKTKDSIPGTYQYNRNLLSATGCDSVITLNLTIDNPIETYFNESVIVGTNYVGHGFVTGSDTLSANIYTFTNTYHTPDGCDSVVILNLTVNNPASTITIYDTVCHGIGYYTGYDFTINTTGLAAGTYLHTHQFVDSTVNLYLTVNPTIEVDIYDTACAGPNYGKYNFAIVTSTLAEGTYDYTQSTYNSTGCDSITNLHLTIHPTKATNLTAAVCQGEAFTDYGFNVTGTETENVGTITRTQNLFTVHGCDSTVTLTLTINAIKATALSDVICKGAVYTDYGFIIKTKDSVPGTYSYIQNLKTINGCDSIVTLTLVIDNPIENNLTASITIGESYIANGFVIYSDTAGIGVHSYSQTYHTADGCDSVVNLTLTINSLVPMTILYDSICHGGFYLNSQLGVYVSTIDSTPGTYSFTRDFIDSVVILYLTINAPETTDVYDSICQGNNYNANGFSLTTNNLAAGNYEYQKTTFLAGGCESITYLHLTINAPSATTLQDFICQNSPYTAYGFNITSAQNSVPGTYTHTLNTTNRFGCDSIVTLTLTVTPETHTNLTDNICKGEVYINNGFAIITKDSAAGTYSYTQNLKTAAGCDSIITLALTIDPVYSTVIYDTICQNATPYTLYGFNESANGTYTQNLTTAKGCDSIVTLYLVVNPTAVTNITATICKGETYKQYGFNESVAGPYTQHLFTVNGCDSTVNLNLIVNDVYNISLTDEICKGDVYVKNGFTVITKDSAAGTYSYTQNLKTSAGCDSIVTLTLTINPVYNTVIYDTICQNATPYTLYGFNESANGTYTQNLTTAKGCDSIVTLYLVVNPTAVTNITATICKGETYKQYGFNESVAGPYTQHLFTVNGCDSTVNLNLIVNDVYNISLTDEICKGDVYVKNGFTVITKDSAAGTYSYTQNLKTVAGCDSIVTLTLTINPVYNTVINDTICQGDAYTLYGFNESANGTYTQNLTTAKGCDSIVTLNLVVNPTAVTNITATICKGETYKQYGFNESVAGPYTQHLFTVNGCDSTVNLNLIVNDVYNISLTDEICKGDVYVKNGFTVITKDSTAGTYSYTQNLKTVAGCDSIVTLTLTINPVYNTVINDTICQGDAYTLYGFNESANGTYTQNLTTAKGCDSIVTLNLVVNPTAVTNITATICKGETYKQYGFNESVAGPYTQNLFTVNGCDSTVNLNLIVNDVYNISLTDEICKGDVYVKNGFTVITKDSAAGTYSYTQNLKTVAGCDSIVTLTLTINPVYNIVIYDTICQGDAYTLYGFNESANGTYTQNLTTAKGCDSIVTLNLVVNPTAVTNITATICKGETYKQYGFNESVAGPYTQHLFTVNGCDSTVNLNLIVNDVYNISLTDEICKGDVYVKNGFTVITKDSAAGTYSYTQNLKTVAGCDSIVTLALTINPVYNIVIYDTICQNATPYTQHGFNASQTGIYTKSLTTATGCDSIVTLNLLVNSNTTTTLYDEVCQGESYHNYNFNIASNKTQVAGVYTYMKNLQATTGCDSVVKLILTVNANKTQTVYDNVCHGDVYIGFGFAIRTEDSIPSVYTYVQNLQTSKGCDSVVTLLLTINPVYNTVIYDTICQGDAYTQYGFNESTNGTYTQNLKTVKGCDSIITLNLTVNPVKHTNLTATICAGEKYTENGFNEFEAGPHTQNLQTVDGCDSIVTLMLIINPVKETYLKDTICHGDVYYNNGFIVFTKDSAAGTYNYAQTLTTSLGCDSTVYLELTINQDYNIVVYDTIESGSIYAKDGFNASLGGSYTLNLSSVTGCDSIVTLKLFVEPKELTRTECDEYDWNGITYKNSGVYTQTVTSSNGTDSTIILNLIVTHSSTAEVYKTNCDTFTWFDSTYTASGNYTHTIIGGNSEGCDSIITLHLTILKTTASELSITACEEYRWEEADTTYYESGDYIFIMPNAAGCDSIITLHLTINQPSIVNVEDSSINDYTWEVNGETYHESGVYSHTIYGGAENGCDSTIILTLTIKEPDGIGDITAEAVSVTAYPNPASDHIDLRIEAADTYTNSRYQLFDVIGKLVTDGKVEGEVTRIGTAQLAPGTYFLRVILANDDIRTIKVVKR